MSGHSLVGLQGAMPAISYGTHGLHSQLKGCHLKIILKKSHRIFPPSAVETTASGKLRTFVFVYVSVCGVHASVYTYMCMCLYVHLCVCGGGVLKSGTFPHSTYTEAEFLS